MTGRLRLSTRLGITHGILVALLLVVFAVTLQGLLRMLGLIGEIRDQRLSSVDDEERVHRAAWQVDVSMRHGRTACLASQSGDPVRVALAARRDELRAELERGGPVLDSRLRAASERYDALARSAIAGDTCAHLLDPAIDDARTKLDEEMTDVWIDRLQELHQDIETKEDSARRIGWLTAAAGLAVAVLAAGATVGVARATAKSVSEPIAALAAAATRLGEEDFTPIAQVSGPPEVEELWRDLELARKRLGELERLKQGFVASVSHEMRTPLASMREALELLADGTCGELDPKQRRVLAIARNACEREVRIVDALLDLSRLRSGSPLRREAGCNIDRVLEAAVEDERADAALRGVEIAIEHRRDVPTVEIDSPLVERAIANLVRNAVSVSKAGQEVRVVREVAGEPEARVVSVEVVDQGPGLDAAIRESIFRPFASAPVHAAGRAAGIGLGLSFAREVARVHGGDLTIARSTGAGTTFRLELPIDGRRAT